MGVEQLTLELDEFCIETTARREYQRLMAALMEAPDPRPELESALELLRAFLEQEDFPAIRSADPDLAGGTRARVRIFKNSRGQASWEKV